MRKDFGRFVGYAVEKSLDGWKIHLRFEKGWLVLEQEEEKPYVRYYNGWWAREFDDGDGWSRTGVKILRWFIGKEKTFLRDGMVSIIVDEDISVHVPYSRIVAMSEKPQEGRYIKVRR